MHPGNSGENFTIKRIRDNRVPAAHRLKILIRGLILLAALVINVYAVAGRTVE
jgi:hypothetical protein